MAQIRNGVRRLSHGTIAAGYALVAGLWLAVWDNYLANSPTLLGFAPAGAYYSLRDWFFIAITATALYFVLRLALPKAPFTLVAMPPVDPQAQDFPVARVVAIVFGVLAATISASALLNYHAFRDKVVESEKHELASITALKRGQLARWYKEHVDDLEAVTSNPFVAAELQGWIAAGGRAGSVPQRMAERLAILKRINGYRQLWLLDGEGRSLPWNGEGLSAPDLDAHGREIAFDAARTGTVVTGASRVDGSDEPRIGIAAPFPAAAPNGERRSFATIYAEVDPGLRIMPILNSWPVPSQSAEVLLVHANGTVAGFIRGNLARRPGIRPEPTAAGPVLARLARGEGFPDGEIVDSTGTPHIIAAERVPGLPWTVVGMAQLSETLAPLNRLAWWSGALVALVLAVSAALALVAGRYQVALNLAAREKAARERQALARHYDYFAKYANDLIVLIDEEGRVVEVNDRAVEESGYAREEILGMNVRQFVPEKGRPHLEAAMAALGEEGAIFEAALLRKDGLVVPMEVSARTVVVEGKRYMQGVVRNVAERKREQRRTAALLELTATAHAMDERALLRKGLDVVQRLTDSRIGFLHFVHENQEQIELVTWTTDTLAHYCRAAFDSHYPVSEAGIWADSIRRKEPVVVNDYATAQDRKGLPVGHAALERFVSVPVIDGGRVRLILGVGNSPRAYVPSDVDTVKLFGNDLYEIVRRKRGEEAVRAAEEQFRGLVEQSIAGIYIIQDGRFAYVNPRFAQIRGFASPDEMIGMGSESLQAEDEGGVSAENVRRLLAGEIASISRNLTVLRQDGTQIDVALHASRATYQGRPAVIGMMQDISERVRAEQEVRGYIARLKTALMGTVEVATNLSEMRDPYTAGHERRVAQVAVAIGAELGLDEERLEGLRVAGDLHDVGKMTIPAEILSKPGKLSAVEYQLIQEHARAGHDVLEGVEFPWPVALVALQHHERFDGSGYPQGLKGEEILLEARIMAVADVVEAMSSHRPYRAGLGIDAALAEIERGLGTTYDPDVAGACLRIFREKGFVLPT